MITLKTETGEITINPKRICCMETSTAQPGDPKINGVFEPFCWISFSNGVSRRVRGTQATLKVMLEMTP